RRHELHREGYPLEDVIASVREMVTDGVALTGEPCLDDGGPPHASYLTFVPPNGRAMVTHQVGKQLHFTTHKTRCADREHCPSFGRECEAGAGAGSFVKHVVVSSEPLHGDNVWTPMVPFEVVGVDWAMKLQRSLHA